MTLVGKIFVIAITFLAICFLALSTVVYSTANDWKGLATKRQDQITKQNDVVTKAKGEAEQRSRDLAAAKDEHDKEAQGLRNQIGALEQQNKQFQDQITAARTSLERASENAKNSLAEAQARVEETTKLRETLANLQSLTNRYKESQLELQDQVVQLERDLGVAKANNKDLRERGAVLSAIQGELDLLSGAIQRPGAVPPQVRERTASLLRLIEQSRADKTLATREQGPPATLQGEITRVDERNRYVEISVGSDDGLIPGHKMYIARTSPKPEYVADVTIQSVEPDKALAVVNSTYLGRKPQEGDLVKPKNARR